MVCKSFVSVYNIYMPFSFYIYGIYSSLFFYKSHGDISFGM